MNTYLELSATNIVRFLRPALKSGALAWDCNYPDKLVPNVVGNVDSPWIIVDPVPEWMHCNFNHHFMFAQVISHMRNRFVPSGCLDCWKVAARPKTVKQLFAVEALQQREGIGAKCGVETRKQVPSLYGAYWYSTSREEGLECYQRVKALPELEGIPIVLKRGCSEYEWRIGDSSKWLLQPGQEDFEEALRGILLMERFVDLPTPEFFKDDIKAGWIEHAFSHGDETALEFTDGKSPFTKQYRTYHEEAT